jgi:hypothetical protein
MNRHDELIRLEAATVSFEDAKFDAGAKLDAADRELRQSWLALGDLLAAADKEAERPASVAIVSSIDRAGKRNCLAPAACCAALSLALALTVVVAYFAGAAPTSDGVASSPESSSRSSSGGPAANASRDPWRPSNWIDQLDEQIAATGEFVIWFEGDPAAARWNSREDRALNSLMWRVEAMNLEASSNSL